MGSIRYFKGHSKKDGRQMIFKVFDEPQKDFFDDEYMVEVSAVEKAGIKHYKALSQSELDNYVSKEITESEYDCYVLIQHLLTEMFLHDFTGGFPRTENVKRMAWQMPRKINAWLNDIGVN